ncbi:MAG: hypothetical protein D6689_04705 [Deltaproteobacteria bacterium]|nr:MAG: hypothetical protein D6689_04705 [Deltaproteobacteria bacterium]
MTCTATTSLAIATAALVAARIAAAGGLVVPGMGPQAQARAGAFVAKADDPTALAHNPAGFAKLDGTVAFIGANFVRMALAFARTGAYEDLPEADEPYEGLPYPEVESHPSPSPGIGGFQAVPYVAVTTDFGHPQWPVRAAIGLYSPQGYAARAFPETVTVAGVDAPAPQRYDVFEQYGQVAHPSVALAYAATPTLSFGARASWGFARIRTRKVVWAIRNYEEWIEKDSVTTIRTTDPFIPSFGLGALWSPSPAWEFGVGYASAVHVRSKGTVRSQPGSAVPAGNANLIPIDDEFARCAPGGVEGALKICLDFDLPQTVHAGGRWIARDAGGRERADVELDVKWEQWSKAGVTTTTTDAIAANGPLDVARIRHGFIDVVSIRLGGAYALPVAQRAVQLRAGVAWDTKTAPLSWTRVDQDGKPRATLATGVAYTADRWRIELGGGYVWEPDRTVPDDCKPPSGPTRDDPGCQPGGVETPVADRSRPDPAQPLTGANNQIESPFNAGTVRSHYVLLHAGVTAWF